MRRRTIRWDRLVPLGASARQERNLLLGLLVLSLCWSLCRFFWPYLYHLRRIAASPRPYMRMPAFEELVQGGGFGFLLTAFCMLALAAAHWSYHYRGSRSIYLMRRLPDRWDLPRRCLALPLLGLAGSALLPLLLLLTYFAVYRLCTPPDALFPPDLQGPLYQLLCRVFL